MVVDPRRDHSIRVPRPDLTAALGTPNSCNRCHSDRSAQWASEQVVAWYGPMRPDDPHFGVALSAGRSGRPGAERALLSLAQRQKLGPLIRSSAVALLGRYSSESNTDLLIESLRDPEPLVRVAAVRSLDRLPLEDLARILTPMLTDPIRLVRTEAARVLSIVPPHQLPAEHRDAFAAALAEFVNSQEATADQPGAHLNLGVVYGNQGQLDRARSEYETALRLDPSFVPVRFNLAILYDQLHDKRAAERVLREAIALAPKLADGYYSLALLLAEDRDRLAEAAELLGTAADLDPSRGRVLYNYGLALQQLGRTRDAERALRAANEREPTSTDILHALAILYVAEKRWDEARWCAEELVRVDPNNPRWRSLWTSVRQPAK